MSTDLACKLCLVAGAALAVFVLVGSSQGRQMHLCSFLAGWCLMAGFSLRREGRR